MRTFQEHNPIAVAVYLLGVSGVAMFTLDPVILAISLVGAVLLFVHLSGMKGSRSHLYTLGLFLLMAAVNPLVSHRGQTVLFVLNDNPVTLEATLYGLAAAGMIVAVMYWFRCFTCIMTSDRLLYLFGALSPKLSLLLSMALRYVPLFGQQLRKTRQAQQAMGLYREDTFTGRLRGHLRVFSVMVTWALENGVITADSMTARGYGCTRRTHFRAFRFTGHDALLTALSLLLTAAAFLAASQRDFAFYPALSAEPLTPAVLAGYAAYALLALLPLIINGKEALRWRCLQSNM